MKKSTIQKIFISILMTGFFLVSMNSRAQIKPPVTKKPLRLRLPDLTVSIISPSTPYPGQELGKSIKVVVRNIGKATAKDFSVDLVLSSNTSIPVKFATYSPNFHEDVLLKGGREHVKSLAPGASINLTLHGINKIPDDTPPGIYYLGVVVDPGKKVKEINEENNTALYRINIKTEKPDLIVIGCSFRPANPTTADRVQISVEMKNQGNVPAIFPAGASEWSATKPTGSSVGGVAMSTKTIAPGQTFSGGVYFIEQGEIDAGTYAIRVKVDPQNRVAESNETNNEITYNLTILEGGKPDLVIIDMRLDPPQVTTQTDFRVVITVKNQGNASAFFPRNSLILGGPDFHFEYAPSGGETIQPNETRVYRLVKGNVQAGTFTWRSVVDPQNRVRESNENNNERTIQVQIN